MNKLKNNVSFDLFILQVICKYVECELESNQIFVSYVAALHKFSTLIVCFDYL